LSAAGMSVRQWATVRCSYCGGAGRVWVEVEEEKPAEAEEKQEEPQGVEEQEDGPQGADSAE